MDKTFRDILAEFLEGEDVEIPSENHLKSPFSTPYRTIFEPLWRPDFTQNPSREGLNRYRVHVTPTPKVEVVEPVVEPPPPPPEVVFALEKLPVAELARVKELIGMGASNLTQGLSLKRLKKAHRLLARKFHPDLNGGSPARFVAMQAAYDDLMEFLLSASVYDTECA